MISLLKANQINNVNVLVCKDNNQDSHCFDIGKVESVLHSTFYPGDYPFQHGDIPEIAAALCYYLVKGHAFVDGNKRTAAIAATVFLDLNGFLLEVDEKEFADMVESAASSQNHENFLNELKKWFVSHSKTQTD